MQTKHFFLRTLEDKGEKNTEKLNKDPWIKKKKKKVPANDILISFKESEYKLKIFF